VGADAKPMRRLERPRRPEGFSAGLGAGPKDFSGLRPGLASPRRLAFERRAARTVKQNFGLRPAVRASMRPKTRDEKAQFVLAATCERSDFAWTARCAYI
jgi:hypothetical protein